MASEGLARSPRLLTAQADALADVVAGQPLVPVLDDLLRAVEQASPRDVMASVLLLDDDGRHLRHGAAPSLPAEYNAAIDGVEIGPAVGSCGTAAHRRARVVVEDIETDPLWDDFRELARRFGLRACWSTPIFGEHGEPAGHFRAVLPRAATARCRRARRHRRPRRHRRADHRPQPGRPGRFAAAGRGRAPAGLELAVEAGGLGTFDWDLHTGALAWDGQLLDIFGIAADRPRAADDHRRLLRGVHPGDRDRVRGPC